MAPMSSTFGQVSQKQPSKSPIGHNFGSGGGTMLPRKMSTITPLPEEKKE